MVCIYRNQLFYCVLPINSFVKECKSDYNKLNRLVGTVEEGDDMSKKEALIDATSRVILQKGIGALTLDAVAAEAGVSKGGLLYHFGTKDALIEAMNIHMIKGFRVVLDTYLEKGLSFHEAYLRASLDTLTEEEMLQITTSLLAAITSNPKVLQLWKEEYMYFNSEMNKEGLALEYTLLVKTVCDGLWFSKLFGFDEIPYDDAKKVIHYLLKEGER